MQSKHVVFGGSNTPTPSTEDLIKSKNGELRVIKVFFLQFTIFVSTMTQKRLCLKNKMSLTVVFRS
mgnify:CR=1 FL=1